MCVGFRFWGTIAVLAVALMAASQGAARTSCDTIVQLVAIEAKATAFLDGSRTTTEAELFDHIELALYESFPDAATAAAESSFVTAYYSTRMMAIQIYRRQGREDARAYMRSSSFRMLTETLDNLHKDRNCAMQGGRALVGDRVGTSPNYEIASGGKRGDDTPLSESTNPTRSEKVDVGHAEPEALPLLPLATAVTGTILLAWGFLRFRRRKPERRLSCNIVVLVSNGSQIKETTLTDISRGGCKIILNLDLNKGDPIKIMWARDWVKGACMWLDDDFCGVMFDTRLTRAQLEMVHTIDRYDEFLRASDLEELGLIEDEKLHVAEAEEERELGAEMDVEWPHRSWRNASVKTSKEDEEDEAGRTDEGGGAGPDSGAADGDAVAAVSGEDDPTADDEDAAEAGEGAGAFPDTGRDGPDAALPDDGSEAGISGAATGTVADPDRGEQADGAEGSDDDTPQEVQLSFDDLFGLAGDAPAPSIEGEGHAEDTKAARREKAEIQPAE